MFILGKKKCSRCNGSGFLDDLGPNQPHAILVKKFGWNVTEAREWCYRNRVQSRHISNEIMCLIMFFILAIRAAKKGEMIMNANTLMSEIKSSALKQIAESLNETLEKIQDKEVDVKQGMAEIVAHKHIIQTIALDWTFNGVTSKAKQLVHSQK